MKGQPPISVMFVCTGNICRSPTAEAVFRACVERAGLGDLFDIQSSGTHDYHVGMLPDARTIETARKHGVRMDHLRASQVTASDMAHYDYIFAMDTGHYAYLSKYTASEAGAPLRLFLNDGGSVPDPYYGPMRGFDEVFDLIAKRCSELLTEICEQHGV